MAVNNKSLMILAAFALSPLLIFSGCSPDRHSTGQNSDPAITVSYSSDFNGETASGYLKLVVEMTIRNEGYSTFRTSAPDFQVRVGEYSYKATESQLQDVELFDGDEITGKLTFQVPPEAALPKTGYEIAYSGQSSHNVRWVKGLPLDSVDSPASEAEIQVDYATDYMWVSAPGIQFLEVEPPGNLYLVVEMTIENRGYESFHTNPDNFFVEAGNAFKSTTAEVEEELIDWREINIPNGGKYTGFLAFHIPTEAAQSFYKWDYKMFYKGTRDYNIRWKELKQSMCVADGGETRLESVYLRDGESLQGRLAYAITQEMASSSATYDMIYDEEEFYNVQWFDQPDAVADIDRNSISYPVIKITYSTEVQQKRSGRLFLMVDILIENIGYESFLTSPINFFLEVNY